VVTLLTEDLGCRLDNVGSLHVPTDRSVD